MLFDGSVIDKGILPNDKLLDAMEGLESEVAWFDKADVLAIEYMKPRGMPTSQEEMDTQFVAGRLVQAFGEPYHCISRQAVKIAICGHLRATDANIRQAVIDRFPKTGGGKIPQIGTQKQPGPLYGMGTHLWSALAIALTFMEQERIRNLQFDDLPDTAEWTAKEAIA